MRYPAPGQADRWKSRPVLSAWLRRGIAGIVLVCRHFADGDVDNILKLMEDSGVPGDRLMVRPIGLRHIAARAVHLALAAHPGPALCAGGMLSSRRSPVKPPRSAWPSSRSVAVAFAGPGVVSQDRGRVGVRAARSGLLPRSDSVGETLLEFVPAASTIATCSSSFCWR